MKKINKKNICIFIVILIFISSKIMPNAVTDLDEMWNFNFARCMANGLKPYKDFNMIIGPLQPFIYSIFLRIFGQEMIVTRILSIIFDSIILFLIYKIMDKIKIKDYIKYLSLIVLAYIMGKYFTFDYNWAVLLVTLIITYIELNVTKNTWKKDLALGILAGLTITLKQTIGIVISLATIGYNILNVRNKEDFKNFLKSAVIRFLGVILVSLIFILILLKLDCIKDYIDYCILSISTFSNKISYLRLIKNKNLVIKILSVIPIIVYIGLIIIYIKKKEKTPLTLLIYSIATMIFVYPISDECHFVLGITITLIGISYIINLITLRFNINKKIEFFLDNFLLCFIVIMGTIFFTGNKNI